jgi:hypothetical protein
MKKQWFYIRYGNDQSGHEIFFDYEKEVARRIAFRAFGDTKNNWAEAYELGSDGLKRERKDLVEEAKLQKQD